MNQQSTPGFPPRPFPSRYSLLPLIALIACLLAGGCSGIDGSQDESAAEADTSLLPMTITEFLFPPGTSVAAAEPVGVAHLSITPMEPGINDVTVELTDLEGEPLPMVNDSSSVTLSYRAITPDATPAEAELARVEDLPAAWQVDALSLPEPGWYALTMSLKDADTEVASTTIYALLPDPSVYGSGAVDLPESDPAAEALYRRALDAYGSWKSGKWHESLGSGTDVVVVTRFAVTNRPGEPPAMRSESLYAGAFREKPDGTMPARPRRDFATRITIGNQGWSTTPDGGWEETSAMGVATFEERAEIYTGATNILPGGTETINGTETEIITFYLPEQDGQSAAWFVWWLDPETGSPVRMMMVAKMHFMIWDFYEVNGDFTIEPPLGDAIATPTTSPFASGFRPRSA